MRRTLTAAFAGAVACFPFAALAQDTAGATALYKEGLSLMEQKRYAEACPKLVESQRLDAGGGTLVAIALCHEAEGKLATAWADWDEAMSQAKRDHRADREKAAKQHIAALEPRLAKTSSLAPRPARNDGRAQAD
jgi:hypothetical protein